jgi:hypothetical protein
MKDDPKPGTPVGPFRLPVSYTHFQCVQRGFREGRFKGGTATWEMRLDDGAWVTVKHTPKTRATLVLL